MFKKCGAGKVALLATPGSAPQGILRGGVGSRNRRRPLKSLWAEQSHASKRSESFGPLAEKKIKANLNYTVFITVCNKFIYKMRGRISRSFCNFPLKPLEEHVGACQKRPICCSAFSNCQKVALNRYEIFDTVPLFTGPE